MKEGIGYIFCIIGLFLVAIFASVQMDYADRNALVEHLHCNRDDIHREFFHFFGKNNRVYNVNGKAWIVNGVFFRDVLRIDFSTY